MADHLIGIILYLTCLVRWIWLETEYFMYAKVIVNIANSEIDHIFDYFVPQELEQMISKGMRVLIPFGPSNHKQEGYVINLEETTAWDPEKVKSLFCSLEEYPMLSDTLLSLAFWMKEKYFSPLCQCLSTVLPSGIHIKVSQQIIRVNISEKQMNPRAQRILSLMGESCSKQAFLKLPGSSEQLLFYLARRGFIKIREEAVVHSYKKTVRYVILQADADRLQEEKAKLSVQKGAEARLCLLKHLEMVGQTPYLELKKALNISDSPIKTLQKQGILTIESQVEYRAVLPGFRKTAAPVLMQEQQEAVSKIWEETDSKPFLLYGITGSGKTEVYLALIERTLQQGKQAIVLAPEISLAPLMVERIAGRFPGQASATHSRMNPGERLDQWQKAKNGEISIMIGPRSALFTPFSNLGLVILDEEQETAYQSDTSPKYDARKTAEELCRLTGAKLVFGSATPSVESFYRAQKGDFHLLKLTSRANQMPLPQLSIQDMRLELQNGNRSIFSRTLLKEIGYNLQNGEQTILFLNRRGYSSFISCRACGEAMQCTNCSVSYTYHAKENILLCHYCGKSVPVPSVCPQCGSSYIRRFGTGTQKVEEEVKKYFPEARVLRMDMDTTKGKYSHGAILNAFRKQEAEILIGTQMVAKGHDFSNVTLVGVVAADLSLFSNDYRSGETTFQLLTQVCGRAGRGDLPGRAVVQTYRPEHYSIQYAAKADYEGFFDRELAGRKWLCYPPFSSFFMILITGKQLKQTEEQAAMLHQSLLKINLKKEFEILNPVPAVIAKIKNLFRFRILVKGVEEEGLRNFVLTGIHSFEQEKKARGIWIQLSLNPPMIV